MNPLPSATRFSGIRYQLPLFSPTNPIINHTESDNLWRTCPNFIDWRLTFSAQIHLELDIYNLWPIFEIKDWGVPGRHGGSGVFWSPFCFFALWKHFLFYQFGPDNLICPVGLFRPQDVQSNGSCSQVSKLQARWVSRFLDKKMGMSSMIRFSFSINKWRNFLSAIRKANWPFSLRISCSCKTTASCPQNSNLKRCKAGSTTSI